MIDLSKKYWFCVYPHVYIINKNNKLLLYNTQRGSFIEIENRVCTDLMNELREKQNLGVIILTEIYLRDSVCLNFINEMIEKRIGDIIEIQDGVAKPITLPPVLNLQRDINKMRGESFSLIGDGVLNYLSELNIFINDKCDQNCFFCKQVSSQIDFCSKSTKGENLNPDIIEDVLSQAQHSSLCNVNILGGNIFLYPHWEKLKHILERYDYKYQYWVHYLNLSDKYRIDNNIAEQWNILVNFPLEDETLKQIIQLYKDNEKVTLLFLIENEKEYLSIEKLISKYKLIRYIIRPYYNRQNYPFFSDYVFMTKEDLFSSPITFRKIFCNQKLNSNNFGKLYILPSGEVKANVNAVKIGNVCTNSLLQIVYEELIRNTAWRNIRQNSPCSECLYQYLCPPPSNYEQSIGKPNLCHIVSTN